jgi:hypothetical protein
MKFNRIIYKFRFPVCSKHYAYPLQRLAGFGGNNCYFCKKKYIHINTQQGQISKVFNVAVGNTYDCSNRRVLKMSKKGA